MFWCWADNNYDGPLLPKSPAMRKLVFEFDVREGHAIDLQVYCLFAWAVRALGPVLAIHMTAEKATRARKALAYAAERAKLAYHRRDNKSEPAVRVWQALFGPTFPTSRTNVGWDPLP